MEDCLNLEKIDEYLEKKIMKNTNKIVCSYYEIKIILNVMKKDEMLFLEIARDKFYQNGYDVFFTNAKYFYDNMIQIVQSNEMLVAIKQ